MTEPVGIGARIELALRHRPTFCLALLCVVLLTYGFKLFNFSIGIDEEYEAYSSNMIVAWLSQGRWGMAVLNGLLIRQPVMPVVSTALALAGLSSGLYLFLSCLVSLEAALFAGLAIGIAFPTFVFILSFSTIAYGIGFGALCVGIFARTVTSPRLSSFAIAALCGGFAIGVYQPFLVGLVVVCLFLIYRRAQIGGEVVPWRFIARLTLCGVASLAVYSLFDWLLRALAHVPLSYVQQQFDLPGLAHHPVKRLHDSWLRIAQVFTLSPRLFGYRPATIPFTLGLAAIWLLAVTATRGYSRVLRLGCLLALPLLLLAIEAVMIFDVPVRSMLYVSFIVAAVVALSLETLPVKLRVPFMLLLACALIGEASVTNKLLLSAATTYDQDREMARAIIDRAESLPGFDRARKDLQIEVSGQFQWAPSVLAGKRGFFDDSVGSSFFEWDMGNRRRIAYFLGLNGLPNIFGANYDTLGKSGGLAEIGRIYETMPVWPQPGSLRLFNGNIVLVKFGPYTPMQKQELCEYGFQKEHCL